MARAGVVAVSLPLASLYLRPAADAGAAAASRPASPVAVATDFNPGSAPSYHLPLRADAGVHAPADDARRGAQGRHRSIAARAVGLEARVGSLEPGKAADFAVIDAPDVNHWLYHFRPNACRATVVARPNRLGSGRFPAAGLTPRSSPADLADRPNPLHCRASRSHVSLLNPHISEAPWHNACTASSRSLLLLLGVQAGEAQVRQITGRVTNAQTEQGLAEATIAVLGTQIVAQAGNDGRFTLNAPDGRETLVVRAHRVTSGSRSRVPPEPGVGERGARAGRLQAGRDRDHRPGHRRREAEPGRTPCRPWTRQS